MLHLQLYKDGAADRPARVHTLEMRQEGWVPASWSNLYAIIYGPTSLLHLHIWLLRVFVMRWVGLPLRTVAVVSGTEICLR